MRHPQSNRMLCMELSLEWTEAFSEAWKECRHSMEDATGTVAVAGGAGTGLETPTPRDVGGRDVFTITHKNMTSEISFL